MTAVNLAWDAFRSSYDTFRQKDGECDRGAITSALTGLEGQVLALKRRAETLPRASVVRTVAELLTEAAVREASALSELRETWRPFDASFLRKYEEAQREADRLRRQAASALEDLRLQYGLR